MWSPETGRLIRSLPLRHRGAVYALACVPTSDGGVLASSGEDGLIVTWDLNADQQLQSPMAGHHGAVHALAVITNDPDRGTLASAGQDGTVRFWDVLAGRPASRPPLTGHIGTVFALSALRSREAATILASAGRDGRVRLWDLHSGVSTVDPATGWIWAVAPVAFRDGHLLAVADDDGGIVIRDPLRSAPVHRIETEPGRAVFALTTVAVDDGRSRIAAAGQDGTIRVWELGAGDGPQPAISNGTGAPIYTITTVPMPNGDTVLAAAGRDGRIRLWDPVTGQRVGAPMAGHTMPVRALTTVRLSADEVLLASAGSDGTVRLWDMATLAERVAPLTGHVGSVYALAATTLPDGTPFLASAGQDGSVRRWLDLTTTPRCDVLVQRRSWVLTLAVIPTSDRRTLLSWAGSDGVVGLTDATGPRRSTSLHETPSSVVFCVTPFPVAGRGPLLAFAGSARHVGLLDPTTEFRSVLFPGSADGAADTDQLDRGDLVAALASTISTSRYQPGGVPTDAVGPTVCSVEGAWGSGKTSLLRMVESELRESGHPQPTERRRTPTLTAARADARLGRPQPLKSGVRLITKAMGWVKAAGRRPTVEPQADPPTQRRVTAWFNPWAHQTSEQVWAGLANAILHAAAPVLYPTDRERESYWFSRNARHVDVRALQRLLRRRTISPVFAFAAFALLAPAAARLLDPQIRYPIKAAFIDTKLHGTHVAVILPVVLFLLGLLHWWFRYVTSRASRWLPPELFGGPLSSGGAGTTGWGLPLPVVDPLYQARSGYLYLLQHDIAEVLSDLRTSDVELVVFIDDLDRCGPKTTAEVLEAVNLFLSDQLPHCRFVLGLDPVIVAAHLDCIYRDVTTPTDLLHPEDPSPGWTFLRKLIQLPIALPRPDDETTDGLVDHLLGKEISTTVELEPLRGASATGMPSVEEASVCVASGSEVSVPGDDDPAPVTGVGADFGWSEDEPVAATDDDSLAAIPIVTTAPLERHPEVREFLRRRLGAYAHRSARDIKRLLTVWSFYAQVLDQRFPRSGEAAVDRARHLLLLAEIVTRWPALQRRLHAPIDAGRGLGLLVSAANDDVAWGRAIGQLKLDGRQDSTAVKQLRIALQGDDATHAAALAVHLC
ncbi:hypothetical protein GCM10009558_009470 [Virgisporangium aurantiacum]